VGGISPCTEVNVVSQLTKGLHSRTTETYKYNRGQDIGFTLGALGSDTMYLNCFLNAQQGQGDCRDFANYLVLGASAVGVDVGARRCDNSNGAGFRTNSYYPAGCTDYGFDEFVFHQYGLLTNVYDAAIRFSAGGEPPTNLVEENDTLDDYETALVNTYLGSQPRGWRTYGTNKPAIHKAWLPTIDAVTPYDITTSSARVYWETNVAATSKVHWDTVSHPSGGSSAYANHSEEYAIFPSVSVHRMYIGGLNSGTMYYYRVESSDALSGEDSFTTQQ
jgi:hypothetical protein